MTTWPDNDPLRMDDPQSDLSPNERIKRALDAFILAGFPANEVVAKAWFYQALGLEYPSDNMAHADANKLELKFVQYFTGFRRSCCASTTLPSLPTTTVPTWWCRRAEQANWAQQELNDELRSSFKKARDRAYFVDTSALTDAQRNERRAIMTEMQKRAENAGSKMRRHKRYADIFGVKISDRVIGG